VSSVPDHQPSDAPDVVDVRDVVDPASVRRAPRYKTFFVIGVVAGIVLGAAFALNLLATIDPARDMPLYKPGVYVSVTVLGTTMITTMLAGLVALWLDRRSLRRHRSNRGV
jgi:hypothetical protein